MAKSVNDTAALTHMQCKETLHLVLVSHEICGRGVGPSEDIMGWPNFMVNLQLKKPCKTETAYTGKYFQTSFQDATYISDDSLIIQVVCSVQTQRPSCSFLLTFRSQKCHLAAKNRTTERDRSILYEKPHPEPLIHDHCESADDWSRQKLLTLTNTPRHIY